MLVPFVEPAAQCVSQIQGIRLLVQEKFHLDCP